ncbi:MAG UNVERIFIED_CONTAM: hypothetical protein LVR29_31255 [Microcystis novacekii LVE1205-3]
MRNYHRDNGSYWNNPHNWLWDVGENFREGAESLRRLDTLLSLRFTDAGLSMDKLIGIRSIIITNFP